MFLKQTYNPEGIVFDLPIESLILINPPIDAVLAGIVRKHCLPWPNLRGRGCEITVCLHSLQTFSKRFYEKTRRTLTWHRCNSVLNGRINFKFSSSLTGVSGTKTL